MRWKKAGKKKIPLLILAACLVAFGIYAGVDQIIFQTRKAEYVSETKQYVGELAEANSITPGERSKGTTAVVAGQKKKMNRLNQKYPAKGEQDMIRIYLSEMETQLDGGWKWYGTKIDDVKEVSAWKSPLERKAHIVLSYTETVSCESGGIVLYDGGVSMLELEKGRHEVQTFCQNEYSVSGGGQISQVSTRGSNQKASLTDSQPSKEKKLLA